MIFTVVRLLSTGRCPCGGRGWGRTRRVGHVDSGHPRREGLSKCTKHRTDLMTKSTFYLEFISVILDCICLWFKESISDRLT